jgi:glycine cleavage system H lipoate-binding protein/ABC-type phosphate transport system substrate-binding protein
MKSLLYIVAGLMFSLAGINNHRVLAGNPQESAPESTIRIISSPDLMELTANWVKNYKQSHPTAGIIVSETTESGITAAGHISFLNAEAAGTLSAATVLKMAIGRDAVVFVTNPAHPGLKELATRGITPEKAAVLLMENSLKSWENISNPNSVQLFLSSDNAVIRQIGEYASMDGSSIKATLSTGSDAFLQAIRNNVQAIGICKLADVIDPSTGLFLQGISLIPVDRNKNGRIDHFENIYESPETFTRGIWTGKYPASLTDHIYAVVPEQPANAAAAGFLAWINRQGQENLNLFGYADISTSEQQANVAQLFPEILLTDTAVEKTASNRWIIILITAIVAILAVYSLFVYFRNRKLAVTAERFRMSAALSPETIKAPAGLYYDKSHTWSFMEKDGTVRIGIDDFMQHITGPLTRVRMKESGEKVRKGEKIITLIRDGKQLEIYAPISGTIRQYNEELLTASAKINTSPYTEGWVYTIEPSNWAKEIQFLIPGMDYREWITDEFARLRDFFAMTVNRNTLAYQHLVLQDGGEITDHVLAEMSPEVWEDFQTKFIDTAK